MADGENALVPLAELGITREDKALDALSGGDFLPRIMLMQSGSEQVKEGKIQQGHFALVADKANPIDIGDMFDCLLLGRRPKATYLENLQIIDDVYDMDSPIFNRIKAASSVKEDGVSNMYGPEFLIYLTKEKRFATFFFSNPTLRREGGTASGLLGKAATFEKKLIKANNRSWFGAKVFECKTPVELPSMEDMKAEVEKFKNPKPRVREEAPKQARER